MLIDCGWSSKSDVKLESLTSDRASEKSVSTAPVAMAENGHQSCVEKSASKKKGGEGGRGERGEGKFGGPSLAV